ncbi:protein ENHANCED DOWNY MILDEW 2-like isoform X2 [Rhododendron vialii]|uniref:protein ENHANCED DOWNY MILDEW 2-like isoform X2 n=1 Tax=Rhododendron vialii TaxID=182163 RepID=UPI00265EDE94|nr:protein ENHANCED DOWNY MILDEW 2-like isoform X2 [Rhododendron vialii]
MASSDEEGEILPDYVANYHLVDENEEPISFSSLPLCWSDNEIPDWLGTQIYLRGSADGGLQQIYKKVKAWKFELSYVLPEIYLLFKDKTWIKLQKPRKSFENTVKKILITVHFLHFLKRNPEETKNAVWNHLRKAFSSYDIEPSESDLLDHMPLINEVAARDKEIAKSEYLSSLLLEMAEERKCLHEDNQTTKKVKFIIDATYDDDDGDDGDDDESDASVLFDTVCSICDNGGELLCCEGRCMRSFHATVDAGADTECESLGYSDAQVEAIQNFLCMNCQHQQHQCFVCGMLGSSNNASVLEVFPCVSATCGRFYHPKCVAKLLYPGDETQAEEVQKKIAAGESFACPAHKCCICKQGEDKRVIDLQFAMCRRCPNAYHRKCLPREIAFDGKTFHQRAWDGLLPNRILIYCMNHKIIPKLGTPERNHIVFPGIDGKKKRLKLLSLKEEEEARKRRLKQLAQNRSTLSGSVMERTAVKMEKKVEEYPSFTHGDLTKKFGQGFPRQGVGSKVADVTMNSLRANNASVQANVCKPFKGDNSHSSLGNNHSVLSMRPYVVRPKMQDLPSGKAKNSIEAIPAMEKVSKTLPSVDTELEKRMMALMNTSTASFNLEEFRKEKRRLCSNESSSKYVLDKTITSGRVEGYVKAIQAALKKLEEGCTLEDARAVCQAEVLKKIVIWKRKLGVYLAPFLHGVRYTSFGRHFTKVDKLKEIIDLLHWYVLENDTIVDFCCGSNDFSWLLKEKLQQMGKSCSFKNYDLIQSKNDFNFEKRDWMTVRTEELPAGSQLIMGLNPPFGVQASRANQFIEKALTFNPKLLILIVPRETKRLDEKYPPYDLIWEDHKILSGKSFYLPGSVDMHDQQLDQWNQVTPPLYLWSRPDWTAKHRAIAQRHEHLPKEQEAAHTKGENSRTTISNYLMEENHDCYNNFSSIMNGYGDISRILDDIPEDSAYEVENEGGGAENVAGDDYSCTIFSDELERMLDKVENEGGGAENVPDDDHSCSISSDELERMLDEGLPQGNRSKGDLQIVDEMLMDMENLVKTVAQLQQSP